MKEEKKRFQGMEKRRAMRVTHSYVIRFRQVRSPVASEGWDTSTVKNVSKTGICFYASHNYRPDAELEIRMSNPVSQQESKCWVTVIRSRRSEKRKNLHEIAASINKVEEPRKAFNKTIEFFIRKKINT